MELQELINRIERWKSRTGTDDGPYSGAAAVHSADAGKAGIIGAGMLDEDLSEEDDALEEDGAETDEEALVEENDLVDEDGLVDEGEVVDDDLEIESDEITEEEALP